MPDSYKSDVLKRAIDEGMRGLGMRFEIGSVSTKVMQRDDTAVGDVAAIKEPR